MVLLLTFLVSGVFWVIWDLLFLSSFFAILLGEVIAYKNERFTKSLRIWQLLPVNMATVACAYGKRCQ